MEAISLFHKHDTTSQAIIRLVTLLYKYRPAIRLYIGAAGRPLRAVLSGNVGGSRRGVVVVVVEEEGVGYQVRTIVFPGI